MLMNLYGYNNKYYATLNNDIMQDFWHKLILPHSIVALLNYLAFYVISQQSD